MDKQTIIIGGVGLGVLLLVMSSAKRAPAPDYVQTVYGAAAQAQANAPALIAAVGDVNNRRAEIDSQNRQIELAATTRHEQNILDFMATVSGQHVTSEGQTLQFAGENLNNYRMTSVQKASIKSNEKIAIKQINTQAELAKKQMNQDFINGIIGGVTSGLNPGQSLYGGAGASGLKGTGTPASMQANAIGGQLIGQVIQAFASMYGGSGGGLSSILGGGVGKGGQAGAIA